LAVDVPSLLRNEIRAHYQFIYQLDAAETHDVAGGHQGVCPARESV